MPLQHPVADPIFLQYIVLGGSLLPTSLVPVVVEAHHPLDF